MRETIVDYLLARAHLGDALEEVRQALEGLGEIPLDEASVQTVRAASGLAHAAANGGDVAGIATELAALALRVKLSAEEDDQ